MERYKFVGRPDGIGNRIEEIIILESICNKRNIIVDYIWNNIHPTRSYDIFMCSKNVKIIYNSDAILQISEFQNDITQSEFMVAASKIKPLFDIRFIDNIRPVGIHLRGTDRIGEKHSHFMQDIKEFNFYLSKTIDRINRTKPKYIFISSDDRLVYNQFIKKIAKEIKIINPICNDSVPAEYIDFFALSLCSKIYMASKFTSFSICASLVGNIPIVSYSYDESVQQRYKAHFEYDIGFDNISIYQIATNIKKRSFSKKVNFDLLKSKIKNLFPLQ